MAFAAESLWDNSIRRESRWFSRALTESDLYSQEERAIMQMAIIKNPECENIGRGIGFGFVQETKLVYFLYKTSHRKRGS